MRFFRFNRFLWIHIVICNRSYSKLLDAACITFTIYSMHLRTFFSLVFQTANLQTTTKKVEKSVQLLICCSSAAVVLLLHERFEKLRPNRCRMTNVYTNTRASITKTRPKWTEQKKHKKKTTEIRSICEPK